MIEGKILRKKYGPKSADRIIVHAFCYFFLFLFSSHMTRKSSQEKSFYRIWNKDSEFRTIIWLAIYQKKARDLKNTKICIEMKFDTRGQNLTTQNEKWPLCTKMSLSVHVRQHSKASELNFPEKSFSRWKIAPGSHLRQKSISLKNLVMTS